MEIKIPSVGESVKEAVLVEWYKKDGDRIEKDEPLFLIETDKVTLEVTAAAAGTLKISVPAGQTVPIGAVVGSIEAGGEPAAGQKKPAPAAKKTTAAPEPPLQTTPEPEPPARRAAPVEPAPPSPGELVLSPAVRRLVAERNINVSAIPATGPGGRLTKGDVLLYLENGSAAAAPKTAPAAAAPAPDGPPPDEPQDRIPSFGKTSRKAMSPIRRRIAARLLEARQQTAMLTTFNEIDMSRVMDIRSRRKAAFKKKYDVSLGFMSFFIKASVSALREFPDINAFIEKDDIVYHEYYHVGIAIGSDRGLVVPVIRDADRLSFALLEKSIVDFVDKIQKNRLQLSELEGGTFTISNGGVYGSLLSTPILNTPQSGILGMHKIENRPVAVDDQVLVRPMMYVALSYDHRIVDGKGAVGFLKHIKEWIEDPEDPMREAS